MNYFAKLDKGIDFTVAGKKFLNGVWEPVDYSLYLYLHRHRDHFELKMGDTIPDSAPVIEPKGGPIEKADLGTTVKTDKKK